ncbi:hypothetical protein Btru_028764, partial [Bulinus truncatus]
MSESHHADHHHRHNEESADHTHNDSDKGEWKIALKAYADVSHEALLHSCDESLIVSASGCDVATCRSAGNNVKATISGSVSEAVLSHQVGPQSVNHGDVTSGSNRSGISSGETQTAGFGDTDIETMVNTDNRPKTNEHCHSHKTRDFRNALSSVAMMVIVADIIFSFCSGLAIGTAYAGNTVGGISTSVAVFCHELPHEIGDLAVLTRSGLTMKRAICLIYSQLAVFGDDHWSTHWQFGLASVWISQELVEYFSTLPLLICTKNSQAETFVSAKNSQAETFVSAKNSQAETFNSAKNSQVEPFFCLTEQEELPVQELMAEWRLPNPELLIRILGETKETDKNLYNQVQFLERLVAFIQSSDCCMWILTDNYTPFQFMDEIIEETPLIGISRLESNQKEKILNTRRYTNSENFPKSIKFQVLSLQNIRVSCKGYGCEGYDYEGYGLKGTAVKGKAVKGTVVKGTVVKGTVVKGTVVKAKFVKGEIVKANVVKAKVVKEEGYCCER